MEGDEVLARLPARRDDGGRFTFWWPSYRSGLSLATRQLLADNLIQACIGIAASENRFHYLESKPADDVPDLSCWLAALTSQGFRQIAIAHLLSRRVDQPLSLSPPVANRARIICGDEISLDQLKETFIAYQSETLDRADADPVQDKAAAFRELVLDGHSLETNLSLWRVCILDNKPVGFVATRIESGQDSNAQTGTVLSIGILPSVRRRGLGKVLLQEGLKALKSHGATTVQALVDNENTPSLGLHHWAGFKKLPERYMVYRRNLS